jgi:hypothetical protein
MKLKSMNEINPEAENVEKRKGQMAPRNGADGLQC